MERIALIVTVVGLALMATGALLLDWPIVRISGSQDTVLNLLFLIGFALSTGALTYLKLQNKDGQD